MASTEGGVPFKPYNLKQNLNRFSKEPAETKVESRTSHSKSGTSVDSSNSGVRFNLN